MGRVHWWADRLGDRAWRCADRIAHRIARIFIDCPDVR